MLKQQPTITSFASPLEKFKLPISMGIQALLITNVTPIRKLVKITSSDFCSQQWTKWEMQHCIISNRFALHCLLTRFIHLDQSSKWLKLGFTHLTILLESSLNLEEPILILKMCLQVTEDASKYVARVYLTQIQNSIENIWSIAFSVPITKCVLNSI